MLGMRTYQLGLFEADHIYLDHVGDKTFYGFLASMRGQLFRDEEFAEFYCRHNGRESVHPSMLATVLLLQTHDKVSDEEAKARADFDIRWKVALVVAIDDKPLAKSTLQLFRAHLILHEKVRLVFQRSLRLARQTGYLKGHRMKAALDTSYILGRGAVKDTYNLLADGIVQVAQARRHLTESRHKGGPASVGLSVTSVPASKGKQPFTGMTKRLGGLSCRPLLSMRTEYWSLPGRRRDNYRIKIKSDKALWHRRSYSDNC